MEKTNSCLNTDVIIKYVSENAPDELPRLFDGLSRELPGVDDVKKFLSDPNNWVSSSILVKLYDNAKKIFDDEDIAFKIGYDSVVRRRFGYVQKILIYAFGKPTNILRYVQNVNDKFNKTKTIHLKKIEKEHATLHLHWKKEIELSRDFCLFNQGIYSAIPTVWGDKACKVEERKCYFRGDSHCEYHLFWKEQSLLKRKIFQVVAPWKIAKESIRELERDKKILQEKYEKINALNQELENKIDQLSVINETSKAILSTLELTELLDKVLNRMMDIARLDRAGVFLVDKDKKSLSLIHATGVSQEALNKLKRYHIPIDKENNIIARAAREKEPILIEDTDAINLNRQNPLLLAFKPKAFVIVPLTVRGEVVGIMVGDNVTDKNFIKEIDKEFLVSFANHIAMAIENANLYNRIKTSEKKYRQIVENINEGILVMNEGGSIKFANRKMKELVARQDLVGTSINELVIGEEDKKKLVALMVANYSGEQAREEIELKSNGNGEGVPVLFSSVPIMDEDEDVMQGCLGLVTDLTHQKELERKLLQAQKLESIGTMAGGIAHDFNNILTGILGFATLMKEKTKNNPELSRFTEIIEKSSLRAADLVKKMLVFSRDAMPRDDAICNPVDAMLEAMALMKSSFPKNITLDVKYLENCPYVGCSHSQFQQIVMNLCINARDAMPGGGKITIELSQHAFKDLPFVIRKRVRGENFLELSVSDTGSGISPDVLERIFDPFFTTKEVGKGSGLGLAMVYGIMEGIGGAIDIKTKIGLGSTFELYFPILEKREGKRGGKCENVPIMGNQTIMIVDDEEMVRLLASEILSPYGYKLVTAKNGKEAVAMYKAMFPGIDLIIMDVLMPEMDGLQAAKEIKSFDPSAKILFCSGYTSMSEIADSHLSGNQLAMPELIKKPFTPTELALSVSRMLRSHKIPATTI